MHQYGAFENVFFLPHAFDRDLSFDPSGERPYDVVMIGALYDYEAMRKEWPRMYSKELVEVMETVIQRVLGDSHTHFVFAFIEELAKRQIELKEINPREVLQQIEGYFRSYDRIQLITAIKDAHVHVFGPVLMGGEGWGEYLADAQNVTVHKAVPYIESLDIIRKSRIFLNSTPSYKRGGHERIFNGLGLGSLVLSTENLYLPQHFKDQEDILYYRSGEVQGVNELINHYLYHEDERKQIVECGREKVLNEHTWDHRACTFLKEMPCHLAKMQGAI
jgi:spore maturation protein CgeB